VKIKIKTPFKHELWQILSVFQHVHVKGVAQEQKDLVLCYSTSI
jgi:hypothetical protein